MCNVGVLTAGFDDPSIRFVILNRATKSLSLYLQMVGRGARPFANKEHFTVIDLGQNTNRFGFYEDKQDWPKYFNEGSKKESDTVGVAPTKDCPSCNYVNPIQVNNCRGCGFDFKADAEAKKEAEVKYNLEKLAREKPINIPMKQLFDLAKERNYKPYAVLWKIAEHIVKYEKRYQKLVTKDLLNKFKDEHLQLWCDNYKLKKNNYLVRYLDDCIEKTKEKIF
jgi:superfamily II DNA helicase RecQ